jgi:hypothetical protein
MRFKRCQLKSRSHPRGTLERKRRIRGERLVWRRRTEGHAGWDSREDMFLRHAAPGDYKIVASMPDRDGDHMYKIKSPLKEYERVIKEDLLVKSEGCLLEDVPKERPRRRSITLPTLQATTS